MKNAKLYHVQDPDRPMWVVAESYPKALEQWRGIVAEENDQEPSEVTDPTGIQFICDGNELLLPVTAEAV